MGADTDEKEADEDASGGERGVDSGASAERERATRLEQETAAGGGSVEAHCEEEALEGACAVRGAGKAVGRTEICSPADKTY